MTSFVMALPGPRPKLVKLIKDFLTGDLSRLHPHQLFVLFRRLNSWGVVVGMPKLVQLPHRRQVDLCVFGANCPKCAIYVGLKVADQHPEPVGGPVPNLFVFAGFWSGPGSRPSSKIIDGFVGGLPVLAGWQDFYFCTHWSRLVPLPLISF